MTAKTYPNSSMAPDGSSYVTLTDGAGNLVNQAASGITIGSSVITGGATTQVLYNLGGVVSSDAGFTYQGGAGTVTTGINILVGGNTYIQCNASGSMTLFDSGATTWNLLRFGGTTSSYPAIKRNAAAINFRLADDSADCPITAASISTSTAATFHTTSVSLTNGGAATSPTLGAAGPAGATTPTKWIGINDNGTTRYIPSW